MSGIIQASSSDSSPTDLRPAPLRISPRKRTDSPGDDTPFIVANQTDRKGNTPVQTTSLDSPGHKNQPNGAHSLPQRRKPGPKLGLLVSKFESPDAVNHHYTSAPPDIGSSYKEQQSKTSATVGPESIPELTSSALLESPRQPPPEKSLRRVQMPAGLGREPMSPLRAQPVVRTSDITACCRPRNSLDSGYPEFGINKQQHSHFSSSDFVSHNAAPLSSQRHE